MLCPDSCVKGMKHVVRDLTQCDLTQWQGPRTARHRCPQRPCPAHWPGLPFKGAFVPLLPTYLRLTVCVCVCVLPGFMDSKMVMDELFHPSCGNCLLICSEVLLLRLLLLLLLLLLILLI